MEVTVDSNPPPPPRNNDDLQSSLKSDGGPLPPEHESPGITFRTEAIRRRLWWDHIHNPTKDSEHSHLYIREVESETTPILSTGVKKGTQTDLVLPITSLYKRQTDPTGKGSRNDLSSPKLTPKPKNKTTTTKLTDMCNRKDPPTTK